MAEERTRPLSDIENEIEVVREDLVVTLGELEDLVRERMEWRTWVRRRPLPFAGAALLLGFVLAVR
jgi:hypothetical protein